MAGIYVSGNSKVFAEGATITGNVGGGVVVEGGSYAALDGANISNNFGHGVSVQDSKVSAVNAIIKNNGVEAIYSDLGIDPKIINHEQLEFIITQVIHKECKKARRGEVIQDVLGNTALFSGIASVDPIIVAVSAVVACGLVTLKHYKSLFSQS